MHIGVLARRESMLRTDVLLWGCMMDAVGKAHKSKLLGYFALALIDPELQWLLRCLLAASAPSVKLCSSLGLRCGGIFVLVNA